MMFNVIIEIDDKYDDFSVFSKKGNKDNDRPTMITKNENDDDNDNIICT